MDIQVEGTDMQQHAHRPYLQPASLKVKYLSIIPVWARNQKVKRKEST